MSDSVRLKFFKIFLKTQSKERLRIPPAYHVHMEGRKPQPFSLSGPSGDIWTVSLVKDEDADEMYFTSGWATFVEDHSIEDGDILLFSCAGDFNFKVHVFGRSACPKEAAFGARCSQAAETGRRPSDPARSSSNRNPWFTTTIQSSNELLGYVNIPLRFARSNGLLQKHSVTLVDPMGGQWLAQLWLRDGCRQLNISCGWREFSRSNKIKIGDVCTFELLPGAEESDSFMMLVHINELPKHV